MAGEIQLTTLGASADLLTGFPFSSARFTSNPLETRLLRGDNVAQGFIRWDGVKRWPSLEEVRGYLLRPGDVILAMDRPWIEAGLKHATLTEADCPSLLVQRVACLRARAGLDQRFLGYVIRSQAFTDYVLGVQTGTAVPHISGRQIQAFKFQLPPLRDQQLAAELLGALDDKIELNRRMVETLAATARALFNCWFVDFDPVHFDTEGRPTGLPNDLVSLFPKRLTNGALLQNWESRLLREIVIQDRETVDPTSMDNTVVDHFSLPAFDSGRRPFTEPASAIKSLKLSITAPVILFSKLNPETPRVWALHRQGPRPMLASTEFLALRPISANIPSSFVECLFASKAFREKANGMVTGTSKSHQRVQPAALLATEWNMPPQALLAAFDQIAGPALKRRASLDDESATLAALRNTLLPRLISGELHIRDAEPAVVAA